MAQVLRTPTPEGVATIDKLLRLGRDANRHQLTGWETQRNIVQLEPFYINGPQTSTLGDLSKEINERLLHEAPLKEALRFLDEDGGITSAAVEYRHAQERHNAALAQFEKASWFRKRLLARKADAATRQMAQLRAKCQTRALSRLAETVRKHGKIAVENLDRSFRMAHANELHELLERAQKGKSYWIFVFTPADSLCADVLAPVADVM